MDSHLTLSLTSTDHLIAARDATVDISRFKIVKALFPQTAGAYAGPED